MISQQCVCEEGLRPGLRDHFEDRFEIDDDVADDFRRDYGGEERTSEYWHGYNVCKKLPKKTLIKCPYRDAEERRDFYRGVSDARSQT